jgi:hypothetical protein
VAPPSGGPHRDGPSSSTLAAAPQRASDLEPKPVGPNNRPARLLWALGAVSIDVVGVSDTAALGTLQPPPARGRDFWLVAPAATTSLLLLRVAAAPERKRALTRSADEVATGSQAR